MSIDLSTLPPPPVIKPLNYEVVLASRIDTFVELAPDHAELMNLESEPARKLIQEASYRELVIQQATNDAAKDCMLATAIGAGLDNLAALLGVQRLLVNPGDPLADPPVPPAYEDDTRLRQRTQMAMEGTTVAGSYGAYIFHSISASARVKDVAVDSPAPGDVRVTILAVDNDGLADAELLTTVGAYLSAAERRPLTDTVLVVPATLVDFTVAATLHFYPGPSAAPVIAAASAALNTYLASATRIGYDITRSGLFAALHQPGVRLVELLSPTSDVLISDRQAARCTAINLTAGGRDV